MTVHSRALADKLFQCAKPKSKKSTPMVKPKSATMKSKGKSK